MFGWVFVGPALSRGCGLDHLQRSLAALIFFDPMNGFKWMFVCLMLYVVEALAPWSQLSLTPPSMSRGWEAGPLSPANSPPPLGIGCLGWEAEERKEVHPGGCNSSKLDRNKEENLMKGGSSIRASEAAHCVGGEGRWRDVSSPFTVLRQPRYDCRKPGAVLLGSPPREKAGAVSCEDDL